MNGAASRNGSLSQSTKAAVLEGRSVLRVSGPDARHFLQGILTQDVGLLETQAAIYAALLTPQGKILCDFFVAHSGDDLIIDCPADKAVELLKRLALYRLRAKVQFADETSTSVVLVAWAGPKPRLEHCLVFEDPRVGDLGWRIIIPKAQFVGLPGLTLATENEWQAHRVNLGVPEGGRDFAYGDAFPHEADMDQLNGVSFEKGCYVGQEVVSRMQHRGTARKRIVRLRGAVQLPGEGQIMAGGAQIGTLGSVAGCIGIGLVRLDRAAEATAKETPLLVGDVAVTLERPEWAKFDLVPQHAREMPT